MPDKIFRDLQFVTIVIVTSSTSKVMPSIVSVDGRSVGRPVQDSAVRYQVTHIRPPIDCSHTLTYSSVPTSPLSPYCVYNRPM